MRYSGEVALGLVVAGARAGRLALAPVRLAARAPVVGEPLRLAGDALAADGRAARYRLEAIIVEQLSSPELELTIDRVVTAVLDDERTERMLVRILDSELVDVLTERVLASPELQKIVSHVASSPEVVQALSHHTETLAEEMVSDVRQRAQRVDDFAERTVRGWLRRPRPA